MKIPGEKSDWNGFERNDFEIEGIGAIIVLPKTFDEKKRWFWRARFFNAFPNADLAMLEAGWVLAHINVADLFGGPEALRRFDLLYSYMTENLGLNKKTVLEGYSRGGLPIYNWGARNTEKVFCIYADNPVCDFKSWPGGFGDGPGSPENWEKCLKAYGMTEEEAKAYKLNPIDNLAPIAKAGIPLLHVYGDADETVPYYENTLIIAERYKELGGEIELICKPGGKHHPHCLEDASPIRDFVLKHSN